MTMDFRFGRRCNAEGLNARGAVVAIPDRVIKRGANRCATGELMRCSKCGSDNPTGKRLYRDNLTKRVLLRVWLPLIALSYFGTLTIAAQLSLQPYNWRRKAISKLLYPGYDPTFHHVASLGVALTGLLILPFADYIRRKLRKVAPRIVDAGAFALGLGAIGLILSGLIVSHPVHGASAFPRLHEILARTAAFALGAGIIVLWACAAKGHHASSTRACEWRWLLVSWSVVTLPALLVVILRAAAGAHLDWSNPLYQKLESRALWPLGLWEWLGSAAVFLFLLSAALFLPE